MQFKETTMEKYQEIASKIDFVFKFIRANFDKEELTEFLNYIEQVETALPVINPVVWNDHYQDIDKAKKRVKALLNIMDVE